MDIDQMDLNKAHAFIIGGSTGVGAALTRALVAEGAKVTVLALAGSELDDIGRETGAATIAADLSNLDELDGMVARAEALNGPVDIMVCMAAVCPSGPFQDYTSDQIRKTVTVNMIAHMELVRQVLPSMIARRTGTITTTGSFSSEISMIHLGCYIPSKAGLSRFAFDLQSEVRDYGIRVFTFVLGSVKGTPLASKAAEDQVVGFIEARAGGIGVLTPEAVAKRMVEVLQSNRKRGVVAIPGLAQPLLEFKALPDRLLDPLMGRPARKRKRSTA
ncbi:SDR family oxidoreductase [Mycolicibacterium pulveris]|nr:SDR family oxidoreductase [Mycolicibacterium pulveris]MCV6983213.1 SDR family oxidoreductase [Mycolicibacterium pulveris]